MLDTTFLVDLERRSAGAGTEMGRVAPPFRVPAVVWTEYLMALPPLRRQRAAASLESAAVFEPFEREIAEEAAKLAYDLARDGVTLSMSDLQVAATALHFGEPLISNDGSFRRVPGLDVKPH